MLKTQVTKRFLNTCEVIKIFNNSFKQPMQKYNLHKGPLQVPRVSTILINQNWHVLEKNTSLQ